MKSLRLRSCAYLPAALLFLRSTDGHAETLEPTSKWVLDYRDDQCLAFRQYGAVASPVTLGFRPAPNGETYELLVSRPRSGSSFATEIKGSVDLGRGPIRAWALNYGGGQSKSSIYQYRISADEMAQGSSASSVTFRAESSPDSKFALSDMPELLKGLETCTADLRAYWNMGAEKDGRIKTPAKGEVRAVFTAEDYPGEAVQKSEEGTSQFLLMINEKGAIAGCFVVKPSGVPILDAMGCQVIRKRAKYTPALDSAGRPVRSTVVTPPVTWRLEG